MKLKGMTLQDLHFGHKHTERMYKEELPFALEYLRTHEIHILNLNGDYFDRKTFSYRTSYCLCNCIL